jgi:hypothetical protein
LQNTSHEWHSVHSQSKISPQMPKAYIGRAVSSLSSSFPPRSLDLTPCDSCPWGCVKTGSANLWC